MGHKLIPLPDELKNRNVHGIFDDFYHYVTGDDFSTVASDSGTVADSDAAGGVLVISPSDGTIANNDESYAKATQECFKFADDKPGVFEARIQCTDAADDASLMIGLIDAVAADTIVDTTGLPKASWSGAIFHKGDGGTVWKCASSVGTLWSTSSANNVATTVANGGSAYQTLRIEWICPRATEVEISFYIDGVFVSKQTIDPTSATEMQIVLGAKNGANDSHAVLNVDYVACYQAR